MVEPVLNSKAAKEKAAQCVGHRQASGLRRGEWRKLSARGCYFGASIVLLYIIWAHFKPMMGSYAFSSSASHSYLVPR